MSGIEALETRVMLSVQSFYSRGVLVVVGTEEADTIAISSDPSGQVLVNGAAVPGAMAARVRAISVSALAGNDTIDLSATELFNPSAIAVFDGGSGDDNITGGPLREAVFAGDGHDTVRGGGNDDRLYGEAGVDQMTGEFGNDLVDGGIGNDVVYGGGGNDTVIGGTGNDDVHAAGDPEIFNQGGSIDEEGFDLLIGGIGSDRYLFGGSAQGQYVIREASNRDRDSISFAGYGAQMDLDLGSTAVQPYSTIGSIQLDSATGIEDATGGAFDDRIVGNTRDNFLDGQQGNNFLSGGIGDDTMGGLEGNDTMLGGAGMDEFFDSGGDDLLAGGTGSDVYHYAGAYFFGSDVIDEAGGVDSDTLDFSEFGGALTLDLSSTAAQTVGPNLTLRLTSETGLENVRASTNETFNYADHITGNDRPNLIDGSVGNDTLIGGGGRDLLIGGAGDDTFDVADGQRDTVLGGDGSDTVLASDPQDVLLGVP